MVLQGKHSSKAGPSFTYQTRICVNEDTMPVYAALYVTLQHELFADVSAEHTASSRNSDYIRRNDILARMSNALRVTLEGRMSSAREPQNLHCSTLEGLIAQAERQFRSLTGRGTPQKTHQKRGRLDNLKHRLKDVESNIAAGTLRLRSGSRKLWRGQHSLETNGLRRSRRVALRLARGP